MINFLIYHHSQKYSFTRRPNIQLYMQFACYRKQKIKKILNQATATRLAVHPNTIRIHIHIPSTRRQQHPYTHPLNQATATSIYTSSQPGDSNAPRRPHPTPSASTHIGSTSHIQHRSIHTQVNNLTPPQPRTPKKKPEGCAEGPWLYGPFAVFLFSHKNPKKYLFTHISLKSLQKN